jgi:hypothetical protein
MDDGVGAGSAALPAPGRVRGRRAPKVAWSEAVGAAVVAGTRAGMVLRQVCAQPGMPCVRTVVKWAAARPKFAAELAAAREAGGLGLRGGARSSWCPETGEAICARLCLGEAMVSILRDVDMPGYSTVFKWLAEVEEFREAVTLAREIQGLRLAELGWEAAQAATPKTAFATRVKLEHLRWYAAKLSPRKYGATLAIAPEGFEAAGGRGARAPAHKPPRLQVEVTEFKLSSSGKVMAIPPRCETDEQLFLETYGRPYDGPNQGEWRRSPP